MLRVIAAVASGASAIEETTRVVPSAHGGTGPASLRGLVKIAIAIADSGQGALSGVDPTAEASGAPTEADGLTTAMDVLRVVIGEATTAGAIASCGVRESGVAPA